MIPHRSFWQNFTANCPVLLYFQRLNIVGILFGSYLSTNTRIPWIFPGFGLVDIHRHPVPPTYPYLPKIAKKKWRKLKATNLKPISWWMFKLVNHLPFQGNQPTLGYKFPSPVVSSRPSDWRRSTFKKETLAEILCEKPSQKVEKLGHLTVET